MPPLAGGPQSRTAAKMEPRRRGHWRWWLATLAMAAVLSGALPWLHAWSILLVVRDYERQLGFAPPAEAPALVRRLAALGDPALAALAAALGSSRPQVAA